MGESLRVVRYSRGEVWETGAKVGEAEQPTPVFEVWSEAASTILWLRSLDYKTMGEKQGSTIPLLYNALMGAWGLEKGFFAPSRLMKDPAHPV